MSKKSKPELLGTVTLGSGKKSQRITPRRRAPRTRETGKKDHGSPGRKEPRYGGVGSRETGEGERRLKKDYWFGNQEPLASFQRVGLVELWWGNPQCIPNVGTADFAYHILFSCIQFINFFFNCFWILGQGQDGYRCYSHGVNLAGTLEACYQLDLPHCWDVDLSYYEEIILLQVKFSFEGSS